MNDNQLYSLLEAVADIAYIASQEQYYSGDSRADIASFIEWAKEFEKVNAGVKWDEDSNRDYIEAIELFTLQKIAIEKGTEIPAAEYIIRRLDEHGNILSQTSLYDSTMSKAKERANELMNKMGWYSYDIQQP